MQSQKPANKPTRIAPLSGRKGRRFRARWAAGARQVEETIRTIKLPLEIPQGHKIDSKAFAELHATLHEMRPGTLGWLLLTVHSLGFRIFSKSDEVAGFLNSELLGNAEYRQGFRRATGIVCDKLDPIHLYLRFRMVPRPSRGTSIPFTAEVISREYLRYFTGGKANQAADSALASLLSDLANKLGRLDGWAMIASAPHHAFAAWDEVMQARGMDLPALGPRMRRLVLPAKAVARATIAYDESRQRTSLDAGHALQLVVAQALSEARSEGLIELPALAQRASQLILTDNYSGLSWLWGAGLRLLRGATPSKCRRWFGVDEEVAMALLHAAKSIPHDRVFGNDGYAAYRADVGGALANRIRQYIDSLGALDLGLRQCPEPETLATVLRADEPQWLAMRAGTSPDELSATADEVQHRFGAARNALDRLLGKGPAPSAEEIAVLDQYSQLTHSLYGLLSSLAARTKVEIERAASRRDHDAVAGLGGCQFEIPQWCFPLPKLSQGALPIEPIEEARSAASRFNALSNVMGAHAERILVWCRKTGIPVLPFDRLAQTQRRFLLESGVMPKSRNADALVLAVRQVLDRFGKVARRQPVHIARQIMNAYDELKIFARKEELHRYFLSRQGTLYKRPSDLGVRMVMPVDTATIERLDQLLPALGRALQTLRREVLDNSVEWNDLSAVLELERAYYAIILSGLPEILPSAIAKPAAAPEFPLPVMMQRQLQAPTVSARVVKQVFNLYAAKVRELNAILGRRCFFLRHTFTRSRDNALVYVAKDVLWKPPASLRSTQKPIAAAHKALGCWDKDVVSPREVLVRAKSFGTQTGIRDWLVQSPHDWYYTGIHGGGSAGGWAMSKAGMAKRRSEHRGAFRLIGPSSMKMSLDHALLHGAAAIGDMQVICDRHFIQEVARDGSGGIQVTIHEADCSLTLGIPLREYPKSERDPISMNRYMCVDLGEYGLGWATFDTKTHNEVACGFESVRSLRAFAKSIKAGRRPREREPRFGARSERGMENARKRVAGELIHVINSLLSKFRAFPVLEARNRNFFQARGQIERIHQLVIETYAFVDKDSAVRRRTAHWCGSNVWTHPHLMRKDPASGSGQPLNLFPGTVVFADGNSQACSRCGRNAIETVRQVSNGRASASFAVTELGKVELPDGTIVLYRKNPDKRARERYRQMEQHAPRDTTYRTGSLTAQGLIEAIKDNIRRPALRKSVTASSQSRYFCVYDDCAISEHADVNAARNIGRRFRDKLFNAA